MTTTKYCVDCYPDGHGVASSMLPKKPRPAPHPGPRCATHWREVQRDRKAANHEKRVQKVYGLKKGEYAALYKFQGGLCALCRRATGASRRLSVDHSHATGEVRGLLCRPCNSLLGHARDSQLFFMRCINYLITTPYEQLKNGAASYAENELDRVSRMLETVYPDERGKVSEAQG